MIQVFLTTDCPHCGQRVSVKREVFHALRDVPQYHDKFDDASIIFDLDVIRDNAEAALLTEICLKHHLYYHVWTKEDAEEWGERWEESVRELFDDTDAIKDLEWLHTLVLRGTKL